SRAARAERMGHLAAHDLRAAGLGDPAVLASPRRTALGAVSIAFALAGRLRPRAERLCSDRLAPRFRRRPPATTRLGGRLRHPPGSRSEEHTSELQSRFDLVCR